MNKFVNRKRKYQAIINMCYFSSKIQSQKDIERKIFIILLIKQHFQYNFNTNNSSHN